MKKAFLLLALLITIISSIAANSITVQIVAYVPEKVTFETTNDGYKVNSTSEKISYNFYDAHGNETDAYNAAVFNVVAD